MMQLILSAVCLVLLVIVLISGLSLASQKANGKLLVVSLSRADAQHPEVGKITADYKRKLCLGGGLAALLSLVFLIPGLPDSLAFFLMTAFMALVLGGSTIILEHSRMRLLAFKKEQGWIYGNPQVIRVDTAVSRDKKSYSAQLAYLLPPLALSFLPLAWIIGKPQLQVNLPIYGALLGPFFMAIHLWIHHWIQNRHISIPTVDPERNAALVKLEQRELSRASLWLTWLSLVFWLILSFQVIWDPFDMMILAVASVLLIAVDLCIVLRAAGRIRLSQILYCDPGKEIIVDDDYFWHYGSYNNPSDPRVMVEKQSFGGGMIFNLGNPRGRLYNRLVLGAVGIFIALILGFMLSFDLGGIKVVDQGTVIRVDVPVFGTIVNKADIESVSIIDQMPKSIRTNGLGGSNLSLGQFTAQGYGKSLFFIHNDQSPYIVIKLRDKYLFINGRDRVETEEILGIFKTGR